MKVSDKKKQAAYEANSDSIMDFRLKTKATGRPVDPLELDGDLFKLELRIWKRIKAALNIEGL